MIRVDAFFVEGSAMDQPAKAGVDVNLKLLMGEKERERERERQKGHTE